LALSDRNRIERELGQGGTATVYLAYDLRHQREVALNVLRRPGGSGASRPVVVQNFIPAELRAGAPFSGTTDVDSAAKRA
jgi:serine/threonine protein kinase